jgi:hypothetical protein
MDDRIRQIRGSKKNAVSVDTDTTVNLTLEESSRLIKTNANIINNIVSSEDQFELERNTSRVYRLSGRFNIITANELTKGDEDDGGSIRGTANTDWDPLFSEYYNGTTVVSSPTNWVLQVCYPSNKIEDFELWGVNKPVGLGMSVVSLVSNNPSGNRGLLVVNTIQKHKLSEGDYIHINDRSNPNQYRGLHKVFELGQNGENMETSVTLDTSWKGDSTNEMYLNRVANVSANDVQFVNDDSLVSFTLSDMTGGTTNTDYYLLMSGNVHGLGVNDYIEMRDPSGDIMNGFHRVQGVVDDFKFTIKPHTPGATVSNYRYRRMDGTPSDYYVREFEVLTGNDYDIHLAAFSSSVYPESLKTEFGISNDTWLYNMDKDINLDVLTNHRGGIVNELKVCSLKRAGELPYGWSNVTSHWDFNYGVANTVITNPSTLEEVSKVTAGSAGSIEKLYPRTLTNYGSKYIGDIVEYNRKEIKEKVITEVIFRFGVKTGVLTNNNIPTNLSLRDGTQTYTYSGMEDLEGYYYTPFRTIDVRKYSVNIEKAEPEDIIEGIPADYELYSDGSRAWRDLLTDGFIEEGTNGVDWPFLNGKHYLYMNSCVYVRRQNPYILLDQSDIISVNPKNAC